jgi:ribosomal protein S27AE
MRTIKYSDSATCPKCGGVLFYDAKMKQRLPVGFGFAPGSARFQVDYAESTGWRGECMDCGEKVFAVVSSKHRTKYPRAINRKLQAAQASLAG